MAATDDADLIVAALSTTRGLYLGLFGDVSSDLMHPGANAVQAALCSPVGPPRV
jgi:hypothetical protein